MSVNGYDSQGCGCCARPAGTQIIENRPALRAMQYRIGTYRSFLDTMLAAIPAASIEHPVLKDWMARDSRDFGIGFLDMWAYLGDILTFYQERIANEAFLGTATQRESVLRMAALIDYKLGPGAAATAHVVFTLDKDKQLDLPLGLRIQSVPGQNQKPQKFETIEPLAMDARYNQVRVYPPPQPDFPFAVHSPGGTLVNEPVRPRPLAAGNRLVLFDPKRAEIKEIASLTRQENRTMLRFTAPVELAQTSPAQLFPCGRQFRLFGTSVPDKYLESVEDSTAPGGIRWSKKTTNYKIASTTTEFALEMRVEDIKPGSQMLVVHASSNLSSIFTRLGTVVTADARPATVEPLNASVTHVKLTFPTSVSSAQIDLREIVLYEITGAAIQFATTTYPPQITDSAVYIPTTVLDSFPTRKTVILGDGQGNPEIVSVTATSVSGSHLVISFTPALTRPFDAATTVLFGNVARVTHGESVRDEILGNGDAAQRFQKFQVKKTPVTFIPQAGAPNGVASTLQLRVNGVRWDEVSTLLRQAGNARVYATSLSDDGKMTIQFGGEPGARLPSGRNNISATYRQGLGPDGNVAASRLTTLLDRPAGLKSATNPLPASGGSSAETLEQARVNAPNTVRTFGRIVSLRDFADAARELAVVAKASAALEWTGQEQAVMVTLAGENGTVLDAGKLAEVAADLNSRRDTNRKMGVRAHVNVAARISAHVQIDKAYLLDNVEAAVEGALNDLFAFYHLDLGQPVFKSDVFRVCQQVDGVIAVDLDLFRYRDRPSGPVENALPAGPAEILTLAGADLTITPQFEPL